MKLPIILIGPMHSGKSTLSKLLAEKLGIPDVSADWLSREQYIKQGIDLEKLDTVSKIEDYFEFFNYIRPFEIEAAFKIVGNNHDAVISFGAGHSYADTPKLINKLAKLKLVTPNIFLLLPSPDLTKSQTILEHRMDLDKKGKIPERRLETRKEANKLLVNSESNRMLASHIIYTEGKNPKDACEEIISFLL